MKILITDGMEESGVQALRALQHEVLLQKVSAEELPRLLSQHDGIIVRSATKVRKDTIDQCPNLRFIARGGVGMDNIDVDYARSKGIKVINTPAASSRSVAELVMAHLLGITRSLQLTNRELKDAESFASLKKKLSNSTEIESKNLLLIGCGRIGKELAKMAVACGMKVIVHDPFIQELKLQIHIAEHRINLDIPLVDLEQGLKQADYISLHAPFSGQAILSETEFALMKKNAFIINASRGENINETALLHALNEGKIAGAALDVFSNEPNVLPELLAHPQIAVTPHIGASTLEAQERIAMELVDQIQHNFS